jgi:hypothetical protein
VCENVAKGLESSKHTSRGAYISYKICSCCDNAFRSREPHLFLLDAQHQATDAAIERLTLRWTLRHNMRPPLQNVIIGEKVYKKHPIAKDFVL